MFYHPHDLLIAKYFPDEDLSSIDYDSVRYSALYVGALDEERMGREPPRIPWPLPPQRPEKHLEASVEQWRSQTLRAIDARVALFTSRSVPQHTVATKAIATKPTATKDLEASAPISPLIPTHRLLLIPELLELILRQATAQVQHTAWDVNRLWRCTIEHILSTQYRSHFPCPPVEHGEPIDMAIGPSWMQPSEGEIAIVENQTTDDSQRAQHEHALVCYPARITQANSLSEDAYLAIRRSYQRFGWMGASTPVAKVPLWLDLSQFQMNAHILQLFGSRMELNLGRCEISLKAGTNQPCLLRGSLPGGRFAELIADMFLTEPVCKTLGIYMPQLHNNRLRLISRVAQEHGIRVGHFLGTLQRHADKLLSTWQRQAEIIRQKVQNTHWASLSTEKQRLSPWIHHASPTFIVFFEPTGGCSKTVAQRAYHHSGDSLDTRRDEWFSIVTED